MAVRALRGAITVDADEAGEIKRRTSQLLTAIFERNGIGAEDVISVFFTATEDLRSIAPAAGARETGLTEVPLLCATEMPVAGSLGRCVRLLLHLETDRPRSELRHVFLRGATALRPELAEPGDADFDTPVGGGSR
jgi:chorismate mutase